MSRTATIPTTITDEQANFVVGYKMTQVMEVASGLGVYVYDDANSFTRYIIDGKGEVISHNTVPYTEGDREVRELLIQELAG